MKKIFIPLTLLFFACGKDDSPNPTPEPTLITKWRLNKTETITVKYKDGTEFSRDTSETYGDSVFWEFKSGGDFLLIEKTGTRKSAFSQTRDSVTIQPGIIYQFPATFSVNYGSIGGILGATVDLKRQSKGYNTSGVDSILFIETNSFAR